MPAGNHDLTVYFGRCLGGVALAVIFAIVRGIPDPGSHKLLFELIFFVTGLMTLVHIWGAVRRQQPWPETVEIGVPAVLFSRFVTGPVAVVIAWLASFGLYS